MTGQRPSFDDLFMGMALLCAMRSTCLRRRVGVVASKNNRPLCMGYNGPPPGMAHCASLGGCKRELMGIPSGQRSELCRAVHAEQNLFVQAATHGISLTGATIHCTTMPCVTCLKMLIGLMPARIRYIDGYPDELAAEMLRESGIPYEQVKAPDIQRQL